MVHTGSHCYEQNEETQGFVVAGGGERNGIEGIAVGIGIVGIEGMLESGGKVTLGTAGNVGMLGSGGRVALGIFGRLGSGGKVGLGIEGWEVGKLGNVGCGSAGIEGNGGNVGWGKLGNCRRWRAAWPPDNDKRMKRAKIKQLKLAILPKFQGLQDYELETKWKQRIVWDSVRHARPILEVFIHGDEKGRSLLNGLV